MEIKNIAKAFIAAQKVMGTASKDSVNPYFNKKYADLNSIREACLPALNENNIAVLQPIVQIDGKSFVKTILLHESGEALDCLTSIIYAKQNDAQAQGSGITYARRYGLQSLVSIGAEDDDGAAASREPTKLKNATGFKPDGGLAKGSDMQEVLNKKNQEDFKGLKSIIENCGGEEELKEVWTAKDNTKIINSLKKRRLELYDMLVSTKDIMKASFSIND